MTFTTPQARTGAVGRVVVVGAGVVGTMHALLARRRGLEVVHLERDAGPRRASVRNFGLIWVSGREAGEELDLALRARELWEGIGADVPGIGLRSNGSLTLATVPAEVAVLEEVVASADAGRRGLALLDPVEVRRRNPAVRGELLAALWCERDAVVEPRLVLPAVRSFLEAGGGYRFLFGRQAMGLDATAVVDHAGDRHEGDFVILCPGDSHTGIAAEHLAPAPLRRCRLQMLETAPYHEAVTTSLADGDTLRYYPAFRRLGATAALAPPDDVVERWGAQLLLVQRAGGGLTIGDTHVYEEPFDFALDSEPEGHLVARAEALLGGPLPPVVRRWAGVYSQCTDERIVWRATVNDGVVVVTGLGGRGMTLSPAVAEATLDGLGL